MSKPLRNPFRNGRYANEKCFCGSGQKVKKCHGREYTLTEEEMKTAKDLFEKWEDSPEGQKFFRDRGGKA